MALYLKEKWENNYHNPFSILDCLEQKMEEGGNLVEINFSFENKKI